MAGPLVRVAGIYGKGGRLDQHVRPHRVGGPRCINDRFGRVAILGDFVGLNRPGFGAAIFSDKDSDYAQAVSARSP
jgi:hypothetical protein